jgi:hypothetical protein
VKWSKAFTGSMSIAALLLPSVVTAESHIQTKAASTALAAPARVNFKIVIPTTLSMHVGNASDRVAGAQTVAIMSNSRNVTLSATVRTPDADALAHGNVILSAAARKVIAQDAPCAPGDARARRVVCTVSMP